MNYKLLAGTDLGVSRICLGTWAFGGNWGAFDETEAVSAVRTALNLGITFFDTAQAYGFGAAERILGRALAPALKQRREDIVVTTKGGVRKEAGILVRDSSPAYLRRRLEQSLRNLGVDHVDLFLIHWPDSKVAFEQTAEATAEFVQEGKARYIGVSNFDVPQMEAFGSVQPITVLQAPYHMLRREIERDILPYCIHRGIGVLAYGPMAHGLLTGKLTVEARFPADDWRSRSDVFEGDTFRKNLAVVERLRTVAQERGLTVAQLAVAWTLATGGVDVAVVGARRPGQLEETARAATVTLSRHDLERIDRILADAVPVGGPSPEGVSSRTVAPG